VSISAPTTRDCPFCVQRASDVQALRREGARGKQLGAWEREILRRSGASELRLRPDRPGGVPLLREVFPERDLRAEWISPRSPSQPVLRAAGARLEQAGLVSLLAPRADDPRRWIDGQIGRDWEHDEAVRRRLALTNFSWRTLLGDEILDAYQAALRRPRSASRIRWDRRLDEAHARADERCRDAHADDAIEDARRALENARRPAPARR